MRSISAASVAKIAQKTGVEPIYIVEVQWSDLGTIMYADRTFDSVQGRILQLGNIENVINITQSGSVQNVSVTLSDTDGALKEIFNNSDIHKKSAWVWQWFTGIPITDRILLFRGHIASPIIWSETSRSLSFDITSIHESSEVGFSIEEGYFGPLPPKLIGQVWPLVFGTVLLLPGLQVDEIDSGQKDAKENETVTKEPYGIEDPTLKFEINKNELTYAESIELAQYNFIKFLIYEGKAVKAGEKGALDAIEAGSGPYTSLAIQALEEGNRYFKDAQKILKDNTKLKNVQHKQKEYNKKSIEVLGSDKFEQNKSCWIRLGNTRIRGYFAGGSIHIEEATHPAENLTLGLEDEMLLLQDKDNVFNNFIQHYRSKFHFIDAGTPYALSECDQDENGDDSSPVRYIVGAGPGVLVHTVFAERDIDGQKILSPVPETYYQVWTLNFGGIPATVCYLPRPLSSRLNKDGEPEGWGDDLWFNVTSTVGPNVANIIIYILENYTNLTYDLESFTTVAGQLVGFPANFALLEKKDAITLIQEIAYLARCAIWIKNNVVFIKFLAIEDTVVETITENDIIHGSLEVTTTETEDIITKYVSAWKPNYRSADYKVILRYNILKYGLHEQSFNYFIYNQEAYVYHTSIFWLIRKSHTFKRIKFRTPLHKMKIETFDTIDLQFTSRYVANGSVIGVVEQANIDADAFEMEFIVWVPVLLGEMEKFDFAYPAGLEVQRVFPRKEDAEKAGSQGPGRQAKLPDTIPPGAPAKIANPPKANYTGIRFFYDDNVGSSIDNGSAPVGVSGPSFTPMDRPVLVGGDDNFQPPGVTPGGTALAMTGVQPVGNPGNDLDTYQYKNRRVQTPKKKLQIEPHSYAGKIVSGSGDKYTVDVYFKGLTKEPKRITNVKQLQIDLLDEIPQNTWAIVTEIPVFISEDVFEIEYIMQVAVWL